MIGEILEEAQDFFEDIIEHFQKPKGKGHRDSPDIIRRTKLAYHFTERVDSLIKIVIGGSVIVSAIGSTAWGFASMGDLVRAFVDSWPGRMVLILLGISYVINGIWRFFHSKV